MSRRLYKIDYMNSDKVKTYIDEYYIDGEYSHYRRTYRVHAEYNGGDIHQFIHDNDGFIITQNFTGQTYICVDSFLGLTSNKAFKGGIKNEK